MAKNFGDNFSKETYLKFDVEYMILLLFLQQLVSKDQLIIQMWLVIPILELAPQDFHSLVRWVGFVENRAGLFLGCFESDFFFE